MDERRREMKTLKKKFRKGQVVEYGSNAILVTGSGDKNAGYPAFAGVVIMSKKANDDDVPYPVGMYSETWSIEPFKKTDIKLSKVIELLLTKTKFVLYLQSGVWKKSHSVLKRGFNPHHQSQ
jgi:hypothetical protein